MREAEGAFGDPTVFIEQAVVDPRHIEVQILADAEGNVIHLFERDCSVQRRHQKVVEIAPAPNLDPELRDRMCADAVRFAREIGYRNAGTVEFLLDPEGSYVFIEMNPRIQVEHTVTEEVTDVDLVQSQLRIAVGRDAGRPRAVPGRRARCAARRCSAGSPPRTPPTTSAPTPARSRPTAPPAAPGVRLDGGTTYTGAEVSAHFDSMLAKLTCRGRDLRRRPSRRRAARSRSSASAASPPTSPFLQAVLDDPDFAARQRHHLVHRDPPAAARGARQRRPRQQAARATSPTSRSTSRTARRRSSVDPVTKLPRRRPRRCPRPDGTRQLLLEVGPEEFARPAARAGRRSRSPTPRSATPTSRCSRPGCAPATCSPWPATSPGPPRSCGRSRPGAARRTTWRCASSPRTRGSGWPRCARRCRTSACRCCCAAATRSATRRTRPR